MEKNGLQEAEARLVQQGAHDLQAPNSLAAASTSGHATGSIVNEETALLSASAGERRDSQQGSPLPPNAWYDTEFEGLPWYKRPGILWIIFPFVTVTLAFGGIVVTKLTLIEDLLCDKYLASKAISDPNFAFMPIVIGDDNKQCDIPEVSKLTAEFTLVTQLIAGVPSAILAPLLGAYSDRRGRTKVLAMTAAGAIASEFITILVATFPQTVSVYWMMLGSVFEGLSGSYIVSMAVVNAYVSDCSPPTKRARALSFVYSCLFGGIAFGPIVSAKVVELTGKIVAPFYMILIVHATFALFMLLVVPESLSKKKQTSAREAWREAKAAAGPTARWRRALSITKALSILWPTGPGSSPALRRNLVLLASVDTVCFGVAMGAITVTLVYTRQIFDWNHSTTQYYVSTVNFCRLTALLFVLPALNRLLRGKTKPEQKQGHNGADNIDLWFIRVGIVFDMLGFIGFSSAPNGTWFTAAGAITAVGGIVGPTLASALTRHIPPHLTGQLFGAMGLLHALARIVAPTIFNGIFAATAASFPQTVFVCLACAFGIASVLSWFIRPHVYYDESESDAEDIERPSAAVR